MKSQKPRLYTYEGKTYQFNRIGFIEALSYATKKNDLQTRITQTSLFESIADKLDITPDAV